MPSGLFESSKSAQALCCLALAFLLCFAAAGCSPIQRGVDDNGIFYSSGQPALELRFATPLVLTAGGKNLAPVPSDASLRPAASNLYMVFANAGNGPVLQHAHAIISTLPSRVWRWSKETWPRPASLRLNKEHAAGQFWTIQIFPLASQGDWFDAFWSAQGRETPRFWLAKRWSATPQEDTRVLAEYREPAPACMEEALLPLEAVRSREIVPPPEGTLLWSMCRKEIEAFSIRANKAVQLSKFTERRPDHAPRGSLPALAGQPDMKRIAGEAEFIENERIQYRD